MSGLPVLLSLWNGESSIATLRLELVKLLWEPCSTFTLSFREPSQSVFIDIRIRLCFDNHLVDTGAVDSRFRCSRGFLCEIVVCQLGSCVSNRISTGIMSLFFTARTRSTCLHCARFPKSIICRIQGQWDIICALLSKNCCGMHPVNLQSSKQLPQNLSPLPYNVPRRTSRALASSNVALTERHGSQYFKQDTRPVILFDGVCNL